MDIQFFHFPQAISGSSAWVAQRMTPGTIGPVIGSMGRQHRDIVYSPSVFVQNAADIAPIQYPMRKAALDMGSPLDFSLGENRD